MAFIVVGGPEPKCGGDLVIVSCVPFPLDPLALQQQFSLFVGLMLVQINLVSISVKRIADGRQIS